MVAADRPVILASASQVRKTVMDALMIPYIVIPAGIDERAIRDVDSVARAERLARAKAETVAHSHDGIVIAGDTFLLQDGAILEKPTTLAEARDMLVRLSDKRATVLTGFCYLDQEKAIDVSTVVETTCAFREIGIAEIDYYVAAFPVLTFAGAFSPTSAYGASFIATVTGSMTGFIYGIPVELLIPLLERSGIGIHPRP